MNRIVPWLVGALVLTISCGTLYAVVQQLERMGANDAPERLMSQLVSGSALASDPRVDLATSLAPFWVMYESTGVPVVGNGYLDSARAAVPVGVIVGAPPSGVSHVTWQPRAGLRFATVTARVGNRVAVVGQSLAPSEARTDSIGLLILAGWLGGLLLLAIGAILHRWIGVRRAAAAAR